MVCMFQSTVYVGSYCSVRTRGRAGPGYALRWWRKPFLVNERERVLGEREADRLVRHVVDMVEPLEPRVAVDEVEPLAARRAQVRDDEVDAVGVTADRCVELSPGGKV